MSEELPRSAPVSSSDDQCGFDAGMNQRRNVGDHLVINMLVLFGALDRTVNNEDFSVTVGIQDLHSLKRGFFPKDGAAVAEGKGHVPLPFCEPQLAHIF